jgi:hypothetical protein
MSAATRISSTIRRAWPIWVAWFPIAGCLLAQLCIPAAQAKVLPVQNDSTARIQALLDNPVNGVVDLPSGTFTIRPVLQLKQAETVIGHGTTLKVTSSAGDYVAVLAGASSGTDLSGLTIKGVTFDQNASGNPVSNVQALYHGQPRFVILVSKGTGITITGNSFLNTNNINTVVMGSATSQVTISGNQFTGVSTPWHDHSSVYTSGTGTTISNNTFTGTWDIAAIETHGNQASVTSNTVKGYYRGINIVSNNTAFTGNTITGALGPVDLWSTVAPGLHDVAVTGNTLGQDLAGWSSYLKTVGIPMPPAQSQQQVFQDPSSTYPFTSITISGNHG